MQVEAEFATLTAEQLGFRPREHAWSMAEVLDHIVRVERSVLEGARKPGVNRTRWRSKPHRRLLTWLVFSLGLKIRVPERVKHVAPEAGAAAADVLGRWAAVRDDMRTFLASLRADQMGQLAIKHPIAGPFAYRDFLAFLEWHLKHHRRQLRRVRAAAGFPRPGE
jgi:hypothetical protein